MISIDLGTALQPQADASLIIQRSEGRSETVSVKLRIDTPIEVEYFNKGGILPYVLEQLVG